MEALSFSYSALKVLRFCPMLLSSERKVLIGLVRPVVVRPAQ